jgi:hypothetical protein
LVVGRVAPLSRPVRAQSDYLLCHFVGFHLLSSTSRADAPSGLMWMPGWSAGGKRIQSHILSRLWRISMRI